MAGTAKKRHLGLSRDGHLAWHLAHLELASGLNPAPPLSTLHDRFGLFNNTRGPGKRRGPPYGIFESAPRQPGESLSENNK